MSVVVNGLNTNRRLVDINSDLRAVVNSYNGLNRNERARLFNTAYAIARRGRSSGSPDNWQRIMSSRTVYDAFASASRRVNSTSASRHKHSALGKAISDFETDNGTEPIFFVCSYHSNCAKDHSDYQGKVYVDRFWRTKVNGSDYYKVLSYIKNRNVLTIQQVVKSPIWLTTRPNCKHYFIPIATADVLSSSPKKLLHQHGAYHYSQDTYSVDDYFRTRQQIYSALNTLCPCDNFKAMSHKR